MSNPAPAIRLLLLEDDERLAQLYARHLEMHGVEVTLAHLGQDGVDVILHNAFDAVLLDVMVPDHDGLGVCRAIREHSDVPIVMVSALGDEANRIGGLDNGADDYVVRPFSAAELLARIRAHVRRARGQSGPSRHESMTVGALTLSADATSVCVRGRVIALTANEFALLRVLASHAGQVLSREQLLHQAAGTAEEAFDRSIDVRISRLRQKLGDEPRRPRLLKTIRGAGYMLAPWGVAG